MPDIWGLSNTSVDVWTDDVHDSCDLAHRLLPTPGSHDARLFSHHLKFHSAESWTRLSDWRTAAISHSQATREFSTLILNDSQQHTPHCLVLPISPIFSLSSLSLHSWLIIFLSSVLEKFNTQMIKNHL